MRRSTWLILALGLAVAPGIACFGLGTTEQAVTGVEVTEPWKDMDLPLGGGEVVESDPDVLGVIYHDKDSSDLDSVLQQWKRALKTSGHEELSSGVPSSSGTLAEWKGPGNKYIELYVSVSIYGLRDQMPADRHEVVIVSLRE